MTDTPTQSPTRSPNDPRARTTGPRPTVSASLGAPTLGGAPTLADGSTLAILERLVGFDTVSSRSNLPLIEWVEDYLRGHGVDSVRVPNADGTKANLIAVIGPADRAGIVLSGHTDVVPVEGQDWSSDPFALSVRDGRAYGRGTCDMKGFVAAALAAVPRMVSTDLGAPLILALSYDEELGCLGAPDLVRKLPDLVATPRAAIVGEPTGMSVVRGHKAKRSLRATVTGRAAHSSLAPLAVNAVEYGALLVAHLRTMSERLAGGPVDPAYEVGCTTVHVGTMHGGTKLNIVPQTCTIEFEFRALPGQDADALIAEAMAHAHDVLEPRMKAIAPETGIEIEVFAAYPGLDTPADAGVLEMARVLDGVRPPDIPGRDKVAFGTEGGLFSDAGIPTVVLGPGSIAQAHKPDEFVALPELEAIDACLNDLIGGLGRR